jgi:hypothetical protein
MNKGFDSMCYLGKMFLGCIFIAAIAGCGNDGHHSNQRPLADAGADQNQARFSVVQLDGTASRDPDGDAITYQWILRSAPPGSAAQLSGANTATPNFTADAIGRYQFELHVSDGKSDGADRIEVVVDTEILYQNDFATNAALNSLTVIQYGSSHVFIDQGQLRMDPGPLSGSNRSSVSVDLTAVAPAYRARLVDNPGKIIWSFNASNIDAAVCGACNNQFGMHIINTPDPENILPYGYSVEGGGFVGNRVFFFKWPFAEQKIELVDGLATLPQMGAFKLVFDPQTLIWELYFEAGTAQIDPATITHLVGTWTDDANGMIYSLLPYLTLKAKLPQTTYFDNLRVVLKYSL